MRRRLLMGMLVLSSAMSALATTRALAQDCIDPDGCTDGATKYCKATTCSGNPCILCGGGSQGVCQFHGDCQ